MPAPSSPHIFQPSTPPPSPPMQPHSPSHSPSAVYVQVPTSTPSTTHSIRPQRVDYDPAGNPYPYSPYNPDANLPNTGVGVSGSQHDPAHLPGSESQAQQPRAHVQRVDSDGAGNPYLYNPQNPDIKAPNTRAGDRRSRGSARLPVQVYPDPDVVAPVIPDLVHDLPIYPNQDYPRYDYSQPNTPDPPRLSSLDQTPPQWYLPGNPPAVREALCDRVRRWCRFRPNAHRSTGLYPAYHLQTLAQLGPWFSRGLSHSIALNPRLIPNPHFFNLSPPL